MASACVNNIGISPENFLDCSPAKFPSYGWLSPRLSFSRDEEAASKGSPNNADAAKPGAPDLEISGNDFAGFQFHLEDPVTMLDADELFADGKLVPLHLYEIRHSIASAPAISDARSPDTPKSRHGSPIDPYLFSPKAPRCSSRWKELLGLKKLCQNSNARVEEDPKTTSSSKNAGRSLKHFLHRSTKSPASGSVDSSINLPLLKDSDSESVSISARLSLSSSSSGHEHEDLPRLSLDSDHKQGGVSRITHQTTATSNLSRVRLIKHRSSLSSENPTARARVCRSPMKRAPESGDPPRNPSVHSPRMNSSGKIVFHSLERSSSSPSSFNGGPRHKHQPGMERSYSANVRVTPVLNVPVGVFGMFSSQQKKENGAGAGGNRNQHGHCRNRTDRT